MVPGTWARRCVRAPHGTCGGELVTYLIYLGSLVIKWEQRVTVTRSTRWKHDQYKASKPTPASGNALPFSTTSTDLQAASLITNPRTSGRPSGQLLNSTTFLLQPYRGAGSRRPSGFSALICEAGVSGSSCCRPSGRLGPRGSHGLPKQSRGPATGENVGSSSP